MNTAPGPIDDKAPPPSASSFVINLAGGICYIIAIILIRQFAPDMEFVWAAVLSLLALRSWTTYELAQQMKRSLHWFWPRAESKLYEEPKKLVAHGLARATSETVGLRPRTVYEITPAGRRALAQWVAEQAPG